MAGSSELHFTTTLQKRGPAAAVVLDEEQVAAVGQGAKRFPVKAGVEASDTVPVVLALEMLHEGRARS